MVGKTALNKEMKHLNGAYFRTIMYSAGLVIPMAKQHHVFALYRAGNMRGGNVHVGGIQIECVIAV